MAANGKYVIGVDLGGTNIQAGVVNARHQVIARAKNKTHADNGKDTVVHRIIKTIEEAIEESKVKPSQITGVGIGAPGTIDAKKGIVRLAVNLRWNDFPLARELKAKLKMPVTLDNDVNVGAWGEYVAGAAKGQGDLLALFVGTGIGGGLVLNGQLYAGHYGTAGEIGHVILHADGALGRSTLENCASRTNIVRLLTDLIRANHPSSLGKANDPDLDNIRSKAIAEALDKKDPLTVEVVRQAAHYCGIAIANAVTLLSLSCVVVGGGMVEAAGKTFVDWVRDSFQDNVFPPELGKCKILASKLGDDAGVIGAADLARKRL
jgi:glucokinase